MGMTRTTADAVLKEFYLPGIREILNNEVFLLSQVETNSEDIEGRRAVLAINTGRNSGVGARAEYDDLPTAGQQGYAEERVPLKYNYGRIELSGPVIASMGSDRGSFTRAVTSESQGVTRDLRNDVNRQLFGTGTGAIAVATSQAANVVTLTAPTDTQKRQLTVGMRVDIGTAANPTASVAGRTITAVNTTTGTITLSGAAFTVTAADIVTRAGAGGSGAAQKEITGLAAQIANTGTLWNVDPTVWPDWKSYVDDPGSGRAVSEEMFIKASQEVNIASGEDINLWISDATVHRNVSKLLTSLKRFPASGELKGGYTGLDMSSVQQGDTGSNTVVMRYDKDCQTGTAWGLTTKRFQWYRMSDWEFMEEDGAVLNRVPNKDAYEGSLFVYAELATDGRNAHAKLGSLT